jgi:hypothetical protein
MLRAGRRAEATALLARTLAVGDVPGAGRAVIKALAQQYDLPELNGLVDANAPITIAVSGR